MQRINRFPRGLLKGFLCGSRWGWTGKHLELWNNSINLTEDCFHAHGANVEFVDKFQSDLHDLAF